MASNIQTSGAAQGNAAQGNQSNTVQNKATGASAVELIQYQRKVIQMRSTPYMNYPAHVHLETLALCPAACSFCPYPSLERQGAKMSDELLDKVLTELTEIPQSVPFQLSPFKVNEPFLDTRLFDILNRINRDLPHASITLTSNSTPITPEKLEALQQVKNMEYLWISTNDYRPAEYEATMKLKWSRTIERLTMIHEAMVQGKLPFRVVLSRVGDGTVEDQNFTQWVKDSFPLFSSHVFQRGGWIGQVDVDLYAPVPNVGCARWFDLSITATGTVAHCCMDGQAKWPIGDVNTQHILEVYNHPEYRKLRESTLSRQQVEPCNTCTFL
ncbi:MAG: SPASM domain-containing protein [Vampirovibrio sp.]|nr:SPASM domain-containing protein [Vampirovibrio sp.]